MENAVMKQEKENNNVVDMNNRPIPRLMTGGRDGDGNDWLVKLPVGTVFVCRNALNPNQSSCPEFEIVAHRDRVSLLVSTLNQEINTWENRVRFCKQWALEEIIYDPTKDDEQEFLYPKQEEVAHEEQPQSTEPPFEVDRPDRS